MGRKKLYDHYMQVGLSEADLDFLNQVADATGRTQRDVMLYGLWIQKGLLLGTHVMGLIPVEQSNGEAEAGSDE